jgi:hypothetical protein
MKQARIFDFLRPYGARLIRFVLSALLVAATFSAPAGAAVSATDAAQLKSRLTPVGGERAGNSEGTIPPWTGGYSTEPPDYRPGNPRPDPFAGEKPLFAVTRANLAEHAARLPEGQRTLLERFPSYRLDIYPTHRTAAAPTRVYDNIFANATRAHAAPEGIAYGVEGASGGIPFPIPHSGAEVIWNHLLAFWGPAREDRLGTWLMTADGRLELRNSYREIVDFPYYYPDATPASLGPWYAKRREMSDGPADLAGRGYIGLQPLNSRSQRPKIWQYLAGQRRVREAPAFGYDTPTPDGAGIESFDEYYLFSGSPDRYEWKLLGKAELYVPYNNNRFHALPTADTLGPHHVAPEAIRWELHRVWVVDATLAEGARHLAPHRRLYFDEDTWLAVYCDAWDASGHLWKFSHATMYLVPDLPAVVQGSVLIYDLQNGGYLLTFAFNDETVQYKPVAPHPATAFTPEALAAESGR